jgi:hypothetical protein
VGVQHHLLTFRRWASKLKLRMDGNTHTAHPIKTKLDVNSRLLVVFSLFFIAFTIELRQKRVYFVFDSVVNQ